MGLESIVGEQALMVSTGLGTFSAVLEHPQYGKLLRMKEKPVYLSDEEFRMHIDLHQYIAARNGPVVKTCRLIETDCPDSDGRKILIEAQSWADGRHPQATSLEDLQMMGQTLAQFHAAAVGFQWPSVGSLHQEPRERIEKALFYRGYLESVMKSVWEPRVLKLYQRLDDARSQLRRLDDSFGPEERIAVHGDPALENALITAQGCILLDMDDAHLGTRLEDLAWLMTLSAGFCREASAAWTCRRAWCMNTWQAIIDGYQSKEVMTSPEKMRLPLWLVASVVCAVGDCFMEGHSSDLSPAQFGEQCEFAILLLDNLPSL